eukprot:1178070-Prorocentrum_minimum.AAC.7
MGSQSFHCRAGKAYLFNCVVNVSAGPKEDRLMTTGLHTVSDIFCNRCNRIVGWKYRALADIDVGGPIDMLGIYFVCTHYMCHITSVYSTTNVSWTRLGRKLAYSKTKEEAFDKTQKYKEGKFILERYESHAQQTNGVFTVPLQRWCVKNVYTVGMVRVTPLTVC